MGAEILEEIKFYISRQNNMVEQYITTRPILEIYLDMEKRPGLQKPTW